MDGYVSKKHEIPVVKGEAGEYDERIEQLLGLGWPLCWLPR